MKRFVFQYASLLKQREAAEAARQRDLAQALAQRHALEDELRRMQSVIRDSKQNLTDSLVGTVDLAAVGHVARYTAQATQRGHAVVRQLAAVEHDANQARAALVEARRAVRALELLRDKHHDAWRREAARREAAAMDEVGTQQFNRGRVA